MLYDYLKRNAEDMPRWLSDHARGMGFAREEFFSSRLVFYPGNGTDGQPVKVFGSTGFAHCFIYADYGLTKQEIMDDLKHPRHGFKGYHTFDRIELHEHDLAAQSPVYHIGPNDLSHNYRDIKRPDIAPFGFLEILERNAELDDTNGPIRLAIIFVHADAHAAFDALFCQNSSYGPPCVIVLQDHGFGGDYSKFGSGGIMEKIACRCSVFPPYLFIADNTDPWANYHRIPDLNGEAGGMHGGMRYLYEHEIAGISN